MLNSKKILSSRFDNRIVIVSPQDIIADRMGAITNLIIKNYLELINPGIGLFIVDNVAVCRQGRNRNHQLTLSDELHVSGLEQLITKVNDKGARIAIRLNHAGAKTTRNICDEQPVAPSAIHLGKDYDQARELGETGLEFVLMSFVHAAERAVEAGADIVELNGRDKMLLEQFLSQRLNHREDKYGGQFKRRLQFIEEIISSIRSRIKSNHLISFAFSIHDLLDEGLNEKNIQALVSGVKKAGANILNPLAPQAPTKLVHLDRVFTKYIEDAEEMPYIAEINSKSVSAYREILNINNPPSFISLDKSVFKRSDWQSIFRPDMTVNTKTAS